jgi:hypothetical protein
MKPTYLYVCKFCINRKKTEKEKEQLMKHFNISLKPCASCKVYQMKMKMKNI